MAEPARLRLKRRADEAGPDTLILESSSRNKRAATPLRYVKDLGNGEFAVAGVKGGETPAPAVDVKGGVGANGDGNGNGNGNGDGDGNGEEVKSPAADESVRRLFRLNKRRASSSGVDVATFVEKKVRREVEMGESVQGNGEDVLKDTARSEAVIERPLKPPSKRARVTLPEGKAGQGVETQAERERMQELAEYMQQAAFEEIKREQNTIAIAKTETKPSKVTPPRLSAQRSRALHQQRVATNHSLPSTKDMEVDDDEGYVYDTYVLARTSDLGAVSQSNLGNVGYLVITEEDESLWQSYLEDEVSEEEGDSADEDENAEDFYGADYPEDELEADDEFGVNAYGYRGGLPEDEEEWDEDTGEYSDDEGLEARMDRLMMHERDI